MKTFSNPRISLPIGFWVSSSGAPRSGFAVWAATATIALVCTWISSVQGQIGQAPSADDVSPTANAEVSETITTDGGQGYSSWSGAARRTIVDFEIPGAVSSHGLKWTRTYSSSADAMWSFGYTWRRWGRPMAARSHIRTDANPT